jgi:hypothetical protein
MFAFGWHPPGRSRLPTFIALQRRRGQGGEMLAGLLVAIAVFANAADAAPTYGPIPPPPPKVVPKPPPKPAATEVNAAGRCSPAPATAQPGEIIVCVERPEGYRLDPDLMAAKRAMRSGRPKRPERMRDTSCAVVGEAGCIGANPGINLIGAALTAAEIAARLARGQEIGSLFVTDPQPSEYQLYVEAKREREAREAEAAAAKAKAAARQAPPAAGPAQ